MSHDEGYERTYRFGPLERRGIAGGLRTGQVLVLGAACLLAVAIFRRWPTATGLTLAIATVAVSCATIWLPVGGRHFDEWAPVVVRWSWLRARRLECFRSKAPGTGARVDLESSDVVHASDLPPTLSSMRLLAVPMADDRRLGVFHDAEAGTYTAVLVVRIRSFGLLAARDQERRLIRWGRVLASLARDGGAVRRIQVLERTLPHDEHQLRQWLDAHGDRSIAATSPLRRSYEALLAAAGDVTQDHEVLVALQLEPRRLRTSTRRGATAEDSVRALVIREVRALADRLEASDAGVVGVLCADECARTIRRAFDPYRSEPRASLALLGPTTTEVAWDRYRADGAVHRTFWVAQWPRLEVGAAFLAPLLLTQSAVRSFSIVLEPVSPARARSAVEAAITSDEADEELRAQRGFRTTARRRAQQAATTRREAELAAGHEELRFAAYLTVTARDEEELERSCDEVLQAAQQAYLDLQPMWGQQDTAFTAGALPLGHGLARGALLS